MKTEYSTPELFAAISKAQEEVENATKGSSNPHFKSKYADLAEVLNTVRPVYSKHGLSILQSTEFDGTRVSVTTLIAHSGGGHVSSTASCVPAKSDGQGVGAATTYLRRYSLAAMTAIAQEDDDGNAAAHNKKPGKAATTVAGDQQESSGDVGRPTDGAWNGIDDDARAYIESIAVDVMKQGKNYAPAYALIESEHLSPEHKIALWTLLDSATRTGLKKAAQAAKENGNG